MRGSTIVRQLPQLLGGQTGKRVFHLESAGVLDFLHKCARRFRSQLGRLEQVLGLLTLVTHDVRPEGVDLLHVEMRGVNGKGLVEYTLEEAKEIKKRLDA